MAKPINVLNTNTLGSSQTAKPNVDTSGGGNNSDSNAGQSFQKIFNKKFSDWPMPVLFLISVVVALLARYAAGLFLSGSSLSFFWQEILKIVFAFMLLATLSALSKNRVIGTAVAILVLLFSFSTIARHDFTSEREGRRQTKLEKQAEAVALIRADAENADFLLLEPNKTHVFKLEAGEETKWRGFPENRAGSYGISSESYDYTVFFTDGTSYKGNPNTPFPLKGKVFFKVRAHSAQTVYITVM